MGGGGGVENRAFRAFRAVVFRISGAGFRVFGFWGSGLRVKRSMACKG